MHAAATAAIIFLPYLGVVSSWIADLVPTSEQAFKDSERGTIALAALVVSGHKAVEITLPPMRAPGGAPENKSRDDNSLLQDPATH